MGNTDLKTAWSPWSLRASCATSRWRNSSYDRFWMSIRFGNSMIFLIRPNVRRNRRLFGTWDTSPIGVLITVPVAPCSPFMGGLVGRLGPIVLLLLLELDRAAGLLDLLLHRL